MTLSFILCFVSFYVNPEIYYPSRKRSKLGMISTNTITSITRRIKNNKLKKPIVFFFFLCVLNCILYSIETTCSRWRLTVYVIFCEPMYLFFFFKKEWLSYRGFCFFWLKLSILLSC